MNDGTNILKNIWVTSDHHFGHKNIIRFCNRPFSDVEQMNEELILRYNSVVQDNDDVYFLGDFAFMKEEDIIAILRRLKGTKYLILGNHDKVIRKTRNPKILTQFEWIKDYHELKIPNQQTISPIVLLHYPMYTWNRMHHGALHFYGHTHNSIPFVAAGRGRDIGVDTNNYYPWNVRELAAEMLQCPVTEPRHTEDGKRK